MVKLINAATQVVVDVPDGFVGRLGAGWEPVKVAKPAPKRRTSKKK